jgi:ParB family chromosome partitioning protein
LIYLPIGAIQRNPHQPRQNFDEQALRRLAQSIRTEGVLQPILVRPLSAPAAKPGRVAATSATSATSATYELVAGERRLRAAQIAGLTEIPALVRQLDERQTAELALIENLQREDLNPIERAQAFEKLTNHFGLNHEQIANRVGIDRATVTNLLRLLSLSQVVQDWVRKGVLSAGQAKALAGVADVPQQQLLAERAVARGWSVRQLEQEVRRLTSPAGGAADGAGWLDKRKLKAASVRDLEEQIGKHLRTKVRIKPKRKKGSGTLEIEFYSIDEFESLLTRLGVRMD